MNKRALIAALIDQLERDLMMTKEAARVAHDAATNEESKPENEYDTRGLEASYLAGAQAKRAGEIDEALTVFRRLEIKDFTADEEISASALIEIAPIAKGVPGKKNLVLLMPAAGGISVVHEGQTVQVITPNSVLGEALVGLGAGDVAEVEIAGNMREYEIISVR